jgi:hypothetical protein
MSLLDALGRIIPNVSPPRKELARSQRLKCTLAVIAVSALLVLTQPALGTYRAVWSVSPYTAFSLASQGITSLMLVIVFLMLFNGSRLFKFDLTDPEQRQRFGTLRRTLAISLSVILSLIAATIYQEGPGAFPWIAAQLVIGSLAVIYLDEVERNYGAFGSGLMIFFALIFVFSAAFMVKDLVLGSAVSAYSVGATQLALASAMLSFIPLAVTVVLAWVLIRIYGQKTGQELSALINRDDSWSRPVNVLFALTLSLLIVSFLISSAGIWLRFLGGMSNPIPFIASYQGAVAGSSPILDGGLLYLISPAFPTPYATSFGGSGGYYPYFTYLSNRSNALFLPGGGFIIIPEWTHALIYSIAFVLLTLAVARFLICLIGVDDEKVRHRFAQICGTANYSRGKVNALINRNVALIALVVVISVLLGGIGANIGGIISLYLLYRVLYKGEKSAYVH